MSIADKFTTIAENTPKVYDAGKNAEYDRFWDCFLLPFSGGAFAYTFADKGWNNETLNIPLKYLPLKPTSTNYSFRGCAATIIPSMDFNNCENLNYTYAYARSATTIGTVILRADGTNVFTSSFYYCEALVDITFEGVINSNIAFTQSSNLSSKSVDNITEHLADLTGISAKNITFNKSVVAKLTDTQRAAIQNKNWDIVS